eukprot:c20298_g2_i1 orf=2-1582(-)
MCAAILGECGSQVPQQTSHLYSQRLLDEALCLYTDRQAELQSIWQEIGEDKWQKLQELSQMVSNAVDEISKKVLERSLRQKSNLEAKVAKSEKRLREHFGSNALQVIAPMELPLRIRLNMNTARLKELHHAKADVQVCFRGSAVLMKLCNQILALREVLKLPPCDSASLEEVLVSTTEGLHALYSGKIASSWLSSMHKVEYPPMFELLHRFYQTLQAIQTVKTDFLFLKATEKSNETLRHCEASVGPSLQDSGKTVARKRRLGEDSGPTATHNASSECSTHLSSPRCHGMRKESRLVILLSNDTLTLEKLSRKILKELEDIMKQVKCAAQPDADTLTPVSLSSQNTCSPCTRISGTSKDLIEFRTSVDVESSLEENRAGTSAPVTSDHSVKKLTSFPCCIEGISPSMWQDNRFLGCSQLTCEALDCQDQTKLIDACWEAHYTEDIRNVGSKPNVSCMSQGHANMSLGLLDLHTSSKHEANAKDLQNISRPASKRWPLIPITNNQSAPLSTGKTLQVLSYPPPPPPPP